MPTAARVHSLAPPERVLLAITLLNLIVAPWSLGAMHLPTQLASAALATLGLAVALWPRADLPADARPLRRLVGFPIFWGGLALAAYVALQGCNPAWRYATDGRSWWLVALGHCAALPSGMAAPFHISNPWRVLVIFVTPWFIACALWIGLHRRSAFRWLFGAIAANGALLAVLGLAQRLSGSDRIFWTYRPQNDAQFMASFIYRNHAGAYFDLCLAVALGLCATHARRWRRRLESPAAAVGYGFAAALLGLGVVFSAGRMAIALSALPFLALAVGAVLGSEPPTTGVAGRRGLAAAVPLLCVLGLGSVALLSPEVHARFANLAHNPAEALGARAQARQAAKAMWADRWLFGWGAGCFRYGFPLYAQRFPPIYYAADHRILYWEHAHDDLIEFPLELGVVGMIPIAVGLVFLVARFLGAKSARRPFLLCAAGGCLGTLVHGWVDFVFQNPAVLTLWCALAIGALRWVELESRSSRIDPGPEGPAGNLGNAKPGPA